MCLFHFPGSRIPTTEKLGWKVSFCLKKKKNECSLVVLDADNTNVYVKVTAHFSSPFCPDKILCEAYYLITVHFYA